MSLLGKYRKESDRDQDEVEEGTRAKKPSYVKRESEEKSEKSEAVPNKERKSPIVSFSIPIDLRDCLQAIRKAKAINLSMWVEKQLREAVSSEFPSIANRYLEQDS